MYKAGQSLKCICRRMTFNLGATDCQGSVTDATEVIVDNRTTQNTNTILGIAPLMMVAWESSDLPVFTPPSAQVLQVLAATSTSVTTTSANTTTSIPTQNTETLATSGLAQEAKIVIGVGTACGIFLVCISIGLLIYRRRLRRSREKIGNDQPVEKADGVGILPKAELAGDSHVREIDSREISAETDGTSVRHELEGDWHGHEVRAT